MRSGPWQLSFSQSRIYQPPLVKLPSQVQNVQRDMLMLMPMLYSLWAIIKPVPLLVFASL